MLLFVLISFCSALLAQPWGAESTETVAARFAPPVGYERVAADGGSFGAWLRNLPVKPGRSTVHLYNGELKANQTAQAAVLDIDVGDLDLQQCADAVIRLRAEYLWQAGRQAELAFNFTSGHRCAWSSWREGMRPLVDGNKVEFHKRADADSSYANFRAYLNTVFTYAGSYSLSQELERVQNPAQLEPGDVFIQGGFPGHAVIVLDVAEDAESRRVFLLAQSYMPAQEIHVLRNPDGGDVWYPARARGVLLTPEWTFDFTDLKRFP